MKTEILYLDCCTSDYFQGFSGEVLAVPVDGATTLAELKQGVEDDYNSSCSDPIPGFIMALHNAFEDCPNLDKIAFPDLDLYKDCEDWDGCYAYFGVKL
jgi:hypothetical protein